MNNDLVEKIELARLRIFTKDPFLGYILQRININVVENIDTAATNGKIIMFGAKFLKKLTLKETIFVLLHELLHIILEHPCRAKKFDNFKRYNVAADIIVNDILVSYGFPYENLPLILGKYFDIYGIYETVEEIYKMLDDKVKYKTLDQHNVWEEAINNDELDEIIDSALAKGYSSKLIDNTLSRAINKADYGYNSVKWKELLNRYVTKDIFDYSFSKIDNRYEGILLPAFIEDEESLKNIWFVVDVSGSMQNQDISLLNGEIERIINHYKSINCSISFFSTITTSPVNFKNIKDLETAFSDMQSTGGTDFVQIFKDMENFYPVKLPSLVVVLTDGMANYPTKEEMLGVPVIWCLTKKRFLPSVGNYVLLD